MKPIWPVICLIFTWCGGFTLAAGRIPFGGNATIIAHNRTVITDPLHNTSWFDAQLTRLVHCQLLSPDNTGLATISQRSKKTAKLLVSNAFFHNGKQITANDILRSIERARTSNGSSISYALNGARYQVVANNSHDIIIELHGVNKSRLELALSALSQPESSILYRGQPGTNHGCGLFVPDNDNHTLNAFTHHFKGRPFIDQITLTEVTNLTTDAIAAANLFNNCTVAPVTDERQLRNATQVPTTVWQSVWLQFAPQHQHQTVWIQGLNSALWQLPAGRHFKEKTLQNHSLSPFSSIHSSLPHQRGVLPTTPLVLFVPANDSTFVELSQTIRDVLAVKGVQIQISHDRNASWDLQLMSHWWISDQFEIGYFEAAKALNLLSYTSTLPTSPAAQSLGVIPIIHVHYPVGVKPNYHFTSPVHWGDLWKERVVSP